MDYRTHDVAVPGGSLRVGAWHPAGPVERVVLGVHGITSSHKAWTLVAERLTAGTLLIAPDLRGRGRSAHLPPPYGMAAHAADCAAVLDALADGRCDVVAGHSMGGYVSIALAAAEPSRVGAVLLIDGGVPLILPDGVSQDDALGAGLGPAAARLEMSFDSVAAYRDFWRGHPALGADFSPAVVDYVDYDLEPGGPPWQSSCRVEAMRADYVEQFLDGPVDRAWPDVAAPVSMLRAPAGLQAEPGGIFAPERLDAWAVRYPGFRWRTVPDVNHYTITLAAAGADAVAAELATVVGGTRLAG